MESDATRPYKHSRKAGNIYSDKPYFAGQLVPRGYSYDDAIVGRKWLGFEKLPWEGSIPIKDVDPVTCSTAEQLLFYAYSKVFKENSNSFFSWLGGRFDSAGYVYFKEDIPKINKYRKGPPKDLQQMKRDFIRSEYEALVPDTYRNDFTGYSEALAKDAIFYDDFEDEVATYDWPDIVVEILFSENEVSLAYYLKMMVRYSYVVKTRDKKWAWRCGDVNGLKRLARMLKGRVHCAHSLFQFGRLCRELGVPEFIVMPKRYSLRKDHWFTGFFEVAGRFKFDLLDEKPYISIVWRDADTLNAIASIFGPGTIRSYRGIPDSDYYNFEFMANVFNDYQYDIIRSSTPNARGDNGSASTRSRGDFLEDDIIKRWWEGGVKGPIGRNNVKFYLDRSYASYINEFSSRRASGGATRPGAEHARKSVRPIKDAELLELVIDTPEGMSSIYTHFISNSSRGPTSLSQMFWHKTLLACETKYGGNYISRSCMNEAVSCAYFINKVCQDLDTKSIRLDRSLPYKSMYDCRADNDVVWIPQHNESILASTMSLSVKSPKHPMSYLFNQPLDYSKIVVLPQHAHRHAVESFITEKRFYLREMYVNTDPIGMEGLTKIVCDSVAPLEL